MDKSLTLGLNKRQSHQELVRLQLSRRVRAGSGLSQMPARTPNGEAQTSSTANTQRQAPPKRACSLLCRLCALKSTRTLEPSRLHPRRLRQPAPDSREI